MWDKPHSLNRFSGALVAFSLLLALAGAMHYVLHLPLFPLRVLQLSAAPQRVDPAQIEAVARDAVRGNFFTVDLEHTRQAFEKLPWVRRVSVRRHFPWRLEVSLEEHEVLAQWNGSGLVNTHGEVFAAACGRGMAELTPRPGEARGSGGAPVADVPGTRRLFACGEISKASHALPRFSGQPDTAAEVAQMYKVFGEQLAPLGRVIVQVSLSPRRAWQLRLDDGMVLELGSGQPQQRLARFVTVYPYSLAHMLQGRDSTAADKNAYQAWSAQTVRYVDLRYRNGFAVSLAGGETEGQGERSQGGRG
jgi:cell division protein FtsQ